MFETAGVRTTGGSKILADWVPETDADLVEKLRAAGAVIIGKTNLDEFGHGGTSTLSHFGPVHNPWDIERIAGGSSGGSAVAVAAGIGPLSYGTETGSSVRRPASYCGIVRLQTYLRYHQPARVVPRRLESRSCRALRAFSARYRARAGRCRRLRRAGPGQRTPRNTAYASRLDASVKGLRVGVLSRFLQGVDPAVRQAFDAAAQSPC